MNDPVVNEQAVTDPGFGERLRRARLDAGVTKADLAAGVGVHESTVKRWELQLMAPHERHLFRIATELGVKPRWLVDGAGPMRSRLSP